MSEHFCDDCESAGRPTYAYPCTICRGGSEWTPEKEPENEPEKEESLWHSLLKDPKDLPVMHDAGVLKRIGINEWSEYCIVTLLCDDGTRIVDERASLLDGKWYSETIRRLNRKGRERCKVIAWMHYPEPYKGE